MSLAEWDPSQHYEKDTTLSSLPYFMFSQTPPGRIAVKPRSVNMKPLIIEAKLQGGLTALNDTGMRG